MAQPQNIIALMMDFDLTLTPKYTQWPLLEHYGISEGDFWNDVNSRYAPDPEKRKQQLEVEEGSFPKNLRRPVAQNRADYTKELVYANVILDYVKNGRFKGLSRRLLRELGTKIDFFPGVPDFVKQLKELVSSNPEWKKHDIKLEFYIISGAIADMIRGSGIQSDCEGIFATEFGTGTNDRAEGEIDRIDFSVSDTEKTRFIHQINKGFEVGVNDQLPKHLRRVRGDCMIYVGDGPTDVPCMSTTNNFSGKCLAVFGKTGDMEKDKKAFKHAFDLSEQGRVFSFSEADYTEGSQTRQTLERFIAENADIITKDRKDMISMYAGKTPKF